MSLIRLSQIKDGTKLAQTVSDLKSNQVKKRRLDITSLATNTDSYGEEVVGLNPYSLEDITIGEILTELEINGIVYYENDEYTIDRETNSLYWDGTKSFEIPKDAKVVLVYAGEDIVGVEPNEPETPAEPPKEPIPLDKLIYNINTDKVTITDYTGTETDIVIPSEIEGYPVTTIGVRAFQQNNLTSVVIPETVTSILGYAFANNSLTSVVIPKGVTAIGMYAFANNSLTSVVLPEGITDIPSYAFTNNQLTSVIIPEGVTRISESAFANNSLTSAVIPKTTINIGLKAFQNNNLTSVVIPEGSSSIATSAFENNDLTSITIPNTVTSISTNAFNNNNLTSVTIPESIVIIGNGAFTNNNIVEVNVIGDTTYEFVLTKKDVAFDTGVTINLI